MSASFKNQKEPAYATPQLKFLEEPDGNLRFRLSGVNVSLANSLRRTILNDIPSYALDADHKCRMDINSSRLHNEILKHRLTCIPVHQVVVLSKTGTETSDGDEDILANCAVEIDVQNETESTMHITTADFKVRDKKTGQYLVADRVAELFPKCDQTNAHIVFARLRPRISDAIPGERIKLTCEFSIKTAGDSSAFSAVSTCAYMNTIDEEKAADAWKEQEAKLASEGAEKEDISFQKRNFQLLDRQRHFAADSFDFIVESVGVYSNRALVKMACAIIKQQFDAILAALDANESTILRSATTMDHCFDYILEKGDYTIGPVIEYFIYSRYFVAEKTLSYCGFKKFHPHETSSTIRAAFKEPAEREDMRNVIQQACLMAKQFYVDLYKMNL